jgi:hypothetical protein
MRLRYRLRLGAALGAVALAGTFLTSGVANAATSAKTPVTSFKFREVATADSVASRSSNKNSVADVAAATITCTLVVNNPHNSTHVPGTVNVVATVSCTRAVASIDLFVALGDDNGRSSGEEDYNTGSASLSENTSLACENGTYEGTAETTVTWPAGYTPSPQTWNRDSAVVSITC